MSVKCLQNSSTQHLSYGVCGKQCKRTSVSCAPAVFIGCILRFNAIILSPKAPSFFCGGGEGGRGEEVLNILYTLLYPLSFILQDSSGQGIRPVDGPPTYTRADIHIPRVGFKPRLTCSNALDALCNNPEKGMRDYKFSWQSVLRCDAV
jgi:hypothetical protein